MFQAKFRTAESYLAGVGASGALLAGAFIMFVILVGVATFDSWPHADRLLPGGDDADVTLGPTQAPVPAHDAAAPNVIKLLGTKASSHHRGSAGAGGEGGGIDGTPGGEIGGNGGSRDGAGQAPVQSVVPPSSPSSPNRNVVQQTVSKVGNAVEADTTTLGNNLGGSNNAGVGGLVSGLGTTVKKTLQGLAGNN
jgi:hypothetical protein